MRLVPSPGRRKPRSKKPPRPPERRSGMASSLDELVRQALDEVAGSHDLAALDDVRVRWLGKKGTLTEQLKTLGTLSAAERPAAGQKINEAKQALQAALDVRREGLERARVEHEL